MQPGSQPSAGLLYSMSRDKLQVFKKYLEDNLNKKVFWTLSSLVVAPVLFFKKPGDGLQFCVNQYGLNAFSIKNKYPLPLIRETLNQLSNVVYFTKLDIVAAFNKICMIASEEWKTVFRIYLSFYEYLVRLFEVANALSFFQNFINNDLETDILNIFIIAYVDNILVFSKTFQEYKKHVKALLAYL